MVVINLFNYIKGKITIIQGDYLVIENNNIGYQIKVPNPFSFPLNEETIIYTYLHVREDLLEIYGFKTSKEKALFLQLISVKGLGPKGALAILASGKISEVIDAINQGDNKFLQRFPGIGAKASQQIILDLHGKIDFSQTSASKENPKITNIKEALKSMGYNNNELKNIIPILEQNIDQSESVLIKLALKHLI